MNDELNLVISYIYLDMGETKPGMSRVFITIPGGLNARIKDLFDSNSELPLTDVFTYYKQEPFEDFILKLLRKELAIDAISIGNVEEFIPNRVIELKTT